MEETKKEYELSCDFGYDITSPVPSVEPRSEDPLFRSHQNCHCVRIVRENY